MSAAEVEPTPECIERGEACKGPVEYRYPLSSTGRTFPRCEHHWEKRLDTEDRLRRDYPDSPTPPSWFDPTYAGESWEDE